MMIKKNIGNTDNVQRDGVCERLFQHYVAYRGQRRDVSCTRASATMISESDTNWGTKSLAILDMPFTAVLDTVLLPWDLFRKDNSVRSRVEKSEERTQAANAVIPPAEMPAP